MQFFKELSESNENGRYIREVFNEIKNKKRIYIFGAGDRAQWLGKILLRENISFDGFLVNQKYYHSSDVANMYGYEKKIYCFEEKVKECKNIELLLGLSQCMLDMSMFNHENIEKVISINLGNREDYIIKYETLLEHQKEIEWLYDSLDDQYSKACLMNCLKGRLTGKDFEFIPSGWSDPEYFIDGFIEWKKNECIVDCGAYDGDTIEEFLRKKPLDSDFEYKIFAFEPDKLNYKKLTEKFKENREIVCIDKAAYSKAGVFGFSSDGGEMSAISDETEFTVEADTIDNILKDEKATFIKMDVEGSELQALMGAEKQIRNNKPRLAICIYHKQEDFWTIPQYIKKIRPDYKLYLKPHSSMPTELVLFCV